MRFMLLIAVVFFGTAASAALRVQHSLPHRADWELYKQANSPDAKHCSAGTIAYYLYNDDDSPVFLECMRL
jgi:hypothetical protein